jgi:hydroxylamine reductase (hybrid-cluster protein)
MLTDDIEHLMNAKFWVESDTSKACAILYDHIEMKRQALGM